MTRATTWLSIGLRFCVPEGRYFRCVLAYVAHTFASRLIDRGVDIVTVSDIRLPL